MKIFAFNQGSSSIKCALYEIDNSSKAPPFSPLWKEEIVCSSKKITTEDLQKFLKPLFSLGPIDVIGHRIVHGGRKYRSSCVITDEVKDYIDSISSLAPLHNSLALMRVKDLEQFFPEAIPVAVFDTAFHRTMPLHALVYPGPYEWYEKEEIERYGFHGISFAYCLQRSSCFLQRSIGESKIVICHLGSGGSLCAVLNGKSIDTTMGFTPLEGLMMDTRCGSIDPGILLHLWGRKKEKLSEELYEKSGLLGVSGVLGGMEKVLEKSRQGDAKAELALTMYIHRLSSSIGAMVASLQGLDVLVFTGAIGEKSSYIRKKVAERLAFLGVSMDEEKNISVTSIDRDVSSTSSKVQVLVIKTEENAQIAWESFNLIRQNSSG